MIDIKPIKKTAKGVNQTVKEEKVEDDSEGGPIEDLFFR